MGFDCPLEEKFHFIYKDDFDNGLTERELDRVFVGFYDGDIASNPEEVADVRRIDTNELQREMKKEPKKFTERFKIIMRDFTQF